MVGPAYAAWVRFAAVAILAAWLPCVPVGLCVAAPAEPARHACCPRQAATVKVAAAPPQCWLQTPAPLPAGPPPPALAAPLLAAHARPTSERALALPAPAPAFSPLAIVLRI